MTLTNFFSARYLVKVWTAIGFAMGTLVIICLMFIAFLIFCSRIITNSTYDGLCQDSCQSILNENEHEENNNEVGLSFLKYTTEIRVGNLEVPTCLAELLRLYYLKSLVCKLQRVSIRSKIRKKKTDQESVPLKDRDGN